MKLLLIFLILSTFLYSSGDNPTEQEVTKIYVATFNRSLDNFGLDYWENQLDISKKYFLISSILYNEL